MPEHTPAPTPSRAVYGFILTLACKIMFLLYLLWALIPEDQFRSVGITCLPQRYWAVVIPIFLLTILGLFAFIIYPSLGLIMTPDWSDLQTIKDKYSDVKNYDLGKGNVRNRQCSPNDCYCNAGSGCKKSSFAQHDVREYELRRIPKVEDLDPIDVSRHLYLRQYPLNTY